MQTQTKAQALEDIAGWVLDNITYATDLEAHGAVQYFAAPEETLALGQGDCDCRAILFAWKAYQEHGLKAYFILTENPADAREGHVALMFAEIPELLFLTGERQRDWYVMECYSFDRMLAMARGSHGRDWKERPYIPQPVRLWDVDVPYLLSHSDSQWLTWPGPTIDSNEVARSKASGKGSRNPYEVTVAASDYIGPADYYCDGTADEVEITAASTFLSGAYGGGTVKLLPGSYSISSYISVLSSIKYEGEGSSTILSTHNGLCFQSTAGSEISSLTINNIAIVAATGFSAINITGGGNTVDTVKITNVTSDAVFLGSVASPTRNIRNCTITGGGTTSSTTVFGVRTIGTDSNIWNNTITGLKSSVATYGINTSGGGQVVSNNISTLTATLTSATAYGIVVIGNDTIINGNRIDTIKNSATSTTAAYGIFITTALTHNSIVQNIVHNCANDTLYANTGNWLFKDNGTSTLTSVNSWQ